MRLKRNLRISHSLLDESLLNDMDAALSELERVGVVPYVMNDSGEPARDDDGSKILKDELVRKAVEFYVKWQYDYMNKSDQWEKAFFAQRDALSLSGDYLK